MTSLSSGRVPWSPRTVGVLPRLSSCSSARTPAHFAQAHLFMRIGWKWRWAWRWEWQWGWRWGWRWGWEWVMCTWDPCDAGQFFQLDCNHEHWEVGWKLSKGGFNIPEEKSVEKYFIFLNTEKTTHTSRGRGTESWWSPTLSPCSGLSKEEGVEWCSWRC